MERHEGRIHGQNRQLYMTDWGGSYFDPFDLAIPKLVTGERGSTPSTQTPK